MTVLQRSTVAAERCSSDCVTEERKIVYCTYRCSMPVLQSKER